MPTPLAPLYLTAAFIILDGSLAMLTNTDLGAALLAAVDAAAGAAVPRDALLASGGTASWMPTFATGAQFNASASAAMALEASETTGTVDAAVLAALVGDAAEMWRPLTQRRFNTPANATNGTCAGTPAHTTSFNRIVTVLYVTLSPPAALVAALGATPADVARLLQAAVRTGSREFSAFSAVFISCTGSNSSRLFSGGVVVTAPPASNGVPAPPAPPTLLVLGAILGICAAGLCLMCCCIAMLWRRRVRDKERAAHAAHGGKEGMLVVRASV